MMFVQLESEVGANGVLELRVPLDAHDARQRVIVTIEPVSPSVHASSDWHEFVEQTYGSCAGLGLKEPPDSLL